METTVKTYPWGIISYHADKKLLQLIWDGKPTSEEYKATFLTIIDFARQNPVRHFLSDTRKQAVVSPADRKWFQTVIVPAAVECGLTNAASIMDMNPFKKYYLNTILSVVTASGLKYRLFSEEEEALEWLLKEDVKIHTR